MKVLLIEDDQGAAKGIQMLLNSRGMMCDTAKFGAEALEISKVRKYDMILLDLMLSDIEGCEVLARLRSARVRTPVMIISGLSDIRSKLDCFNKGADDFVTKPFYREELVSRIKAIVRRSKGHAESIVRVGKLAINLDTRIVEVDGSYIHLTAKEYAVLELLAMRRPNVVDKNTFLSHLYHLSDEPEFKIIDVFMCKLRKKLSQKSGGVNYIDTVWGRGYALKGNDEVEKSFSVYSSDYKQRSGAFDTDDLVEINTDHSDDENTYSGTGYQSSTSTPSTESINESFLSENFTSDEEWDSPVSRIKSNTQNNRFDAYGSAPIFRDNKVENSSLPQDKPRTPSETPVFQPKKNNGLFSDDEDERVQKNSVSNKNEEYV